MSVSPPHVLSRGFAARYLCGCYPGGKARHIGSLTRPRRQRLFYASAERSKEPPSMHFTTWLAFAAASIVLLLIPGPTVILVVSYALTQGRRVALSVAAGV